MGNLIFPAAVCAIAGCLFLYKSWRTVALLYGRTQSELKQLQAHLADRHLIVSHLLDSLPGSFDQNYDRERLSRAQQEAEECLAGIDPHSPTASELRRHSNLEKHLYAEVEMLTEQIQVFADVREIQSVAGCLKGLERSTQQINDAISTYNSAVITLSSCLESRHARIVSRLADENGEFRVFEWGGDSSKAAFIESDPESSDDDPE